MPTPFPGMAPYLEHPELWPDVHNSLVVAIADFLSARLTPRYFVGIEERFFATDTREPARAGRADADLSANAGASPPIGRGVAFLAVELPSALDRVRETRLEIRQIEPRRVVTVVEILSPTTKQNARSRGYFESKRGEVLNSDAHYVEIDLLRDGEPMPLKGQQPPGYRILISREHLRPKAHLHVFGVREPIPPFVLPLLLGDDEPEVDLNAVLHALYDRARYGLLLDYSMPAVPSLPPEDAEWARRLVNGEKPS